jgi:capsid protein
MDAAVLSGALTLPGYEANRIRLHTADWLPTKWDWVDPLKDANAEIASISAGRARPRRACRHFQPRRTTQTWTILIPKIEQLLN